MTLSQSLHACGSRTSIYKCPCHDASTTVASDHPRMGTTCHGKQCSQGKTQVNTISLLIWGGSSLPLFPHTKHVSLLIFFAHHHTVSTKSPQNQNLHFTSNLTTQLFFVLETCGLLRPCHARHLKAQRNSRHCTFS